MSFPNTHTPTKPTKKAKWQVPMRPGKHNAKEFYLEGELKDKFCKLFPKHSNARMMLWFGISFSTLQRFKRELGLAKDMTAIRKEHARDVKKICEKNGYYDSIRGKPLSQAARDGCAKRLAEGFNPVKMLKEKDTRKYKRMLKKRAKAWKATYQREKRRALFGMEQQTKLKVALHTLSHAAVSQKYSMIRRNNYFSDPEHPTWVCYDSETRRSEQSEQTAARHGLRVVGCTENE